MINVWYKNKILKKFFMCVIIFVISFSFSKIEFYNNYFVVVVPWILFCFLNDKWYGFFAFGVCLLLLGNVNYFYYLFFVLILVSFWLVKYVFCYKKMKKFLCFYSFATVFIVGEVSQFIFNSNNYIFMFFLGVISYWIMFYFFDFYEAIHCNNKKNFNIRLWAFFVFFIGLIFMYLNIKFVGVNVSFVLILCLAFFCSRISFEMGVFYSFMIGIFMFFNGSLSYDALFLVLACVINFLLFNTSKFTLVATYFLFVFLIVYQFNLSYVSLIECFCAGTIYLIVPFKSIDRYSKFCFGSERYIKDIIDEKNKINIKFSKKISKIEEVFSFICSKVGGRERFKKSERDLLTDEINVFDSALKSISKEIREDCVDEYSRIERELFKYDVDLLYLDVYEDILKKKSVKLNVRCNKNDIKGVVVPVVNKCLRDDFVVYDVLNNDLFGCYEVFLKVNVVVDFCFGISQKAFDNEVCGDSYLVYNDNKKQMFLISDGMGVSKIARNKSKKALDLFRKFMDVGFDEKQTLNSINYLLKKENNREMYTTLDLFVYDKILNKFYFIKNGACNSYIIKKNKVEVIEGNNLPIGIVDKIHFNENYINVDDGDYIVMVSDGVSDKKISLLGKLKVNDPQKMSKDILNSFNDRLDDETVLVIKIKK